MRGVRLITHEGLRGLYESVGFAWGGESEVVHGGEKWFEMSVDFDEVEEVSVRNPGKQWRGLEGMKDEGGMNAGDLYCPRGECRCLLLKAGVGKWVERPRDDLPVRSTVLLLEWEGEADEWAYSCRLFRGLLGRKGGRTYSQRGTGLSPLPSRSRTLGSRVTPFPRPPVPLPPPPSLRPQLRRSSTSSAQTAIMDHSDGTIRRGGIWAQRWRMRTRGGVGRSGGGGSF